MHDPPSFRVEVGGGLRRVDLAGAAHLELVSGVAQLRPEDAMVEAMLRGWRAQQAARGLREDTISARERLVRRFVEFTNEYPWRWTPAHVDEWSLSLTGEKHLAPSTIRSYQCDLRLFSEFLTDAPLRVGGRRARRRSARGPSGGDLRTSGTRSRTSMTTRATRRRGRLPGRSCSGSSTTPMTRSSGRYGPSARAR